MRPPSARRRRAGRCRRRGARAADRRQLLRRLGAPAAHRRPHAAADAGRLGQRVRRLRAGAALRRRRTRRARAGGGHARLPLSGSFCSRVLDGRFPRLIPDARDVPEAALLDVTAELHIGAYVGVPLLGPTGAVVGMLCAIDGEPCPDLDERDVAALRLLAQVAARPAAARRVGRRGARPSARACCARCSDVVHGAAGTPVLQPIVDLAHRAGGRGRGADPLHRAPPAAHRRRAAALGRALVRRRRPARPARGPRARHGRRPCSTCSTPCRRDVALCVNLGPQTLLTARLGELLRRPPT